MREKVILICEECLSRNYTTSKNPQKQVERIELKKYCKNCTAVSDPKLAYRQIKNSANKNDTVLICGSFYLMSDVF